MYVAFSCVELQPNFTQALPCHPCRICIRGMSLRVSPAKISLFFGNVRRISVHLKTIDKIQRKIVGVRLFTLGFYRLLSSDQLIVIKVRSASKEKASLYPMVFPVRSTYTDTWWAT